MYNGPPIAAEDIYSVYVIMNGTLGMSPGKMAAQAFHCGERFITILEALYADRYPLTVFPEEEAFREWYNQGRRVRVRIAETPHVFERVLAECPGGYAQQDEGLTEVERGSITALVTIPYLPADTPKILTHKKVQTL